MPEYTIRLNGMRHDTRESLDEAIGLAEKMMDSISQGEEITCRQEATVTVENEDGCLLAAVTNRRIVGSFTKQQWGGRKGDDAIYIGEETFDATDAVLLMAHDDLVKVKDCDESSDNIGRKFVDWNGPCYVSIEDNICDYFGAYSIDDITPEALAYARARANPQKPVEEVVTLTIKVKVRVMPGASKQEFIENLNYSVTSNTAGITVADTEITEAE